MFLTYAKSISCANSRHNRDRKLDLTQNLILNVFQSPNRLDIDIVAFSPDTLMKDIYSNLHLKCVEKALALEFVQIGTIPKLVKTDPLRVSIKDLSDVVAAHPKGTVSTALSWTMLDDDAFERLVFAIVADAKGYQRAEWLMRTRAPDRGRDISVWRIGDDSLSGPHRYRVIVQCKHWLTKSVSDTDVADTLTKLSHWEPPSIDVLVVATSAVTAP